MISLLGTPVVRFFGSGFAQGDISLHDETLRGDSASEQPRNCIRSSRERIICGTQTRDGFSYRNMSANFRICWWNAQRKHARACSQVAKRAGPVRKRGEVRASVFAAQEAAMTDWAKVQLGMICRACILGALMRAPRAHVRRRPRCVSPDAWLRLRRRAWPQL